MNWGNSKVLELESTLDACARLCEADNAGIERMIDLAHELFPHSVETALAQCARRVQAPKYDRYHDAHMLSQASSSQPYSSSWPSPRDEPARRLAYWCLVRT